MRPLERAPEILIAVACAAAPLALGAVHTPVIFALFVALALATGLVMADARGSRGVVRVSPAGLAFGLLAVVSLLQLVPLPAGLLGVLSGRAAELWAESMALVGLEATAHGVSMQPASTAAAALRFATLALAAFAVANLRDRTSTWRVIVVSVVGAALLSWAIGWGHRLAGATTFYGFYQAAIAPKISTFVSSNHASSLFGLASLLALVFAWRSVQAGRREVAAGLVLVGAALFVGMMESDSAGALGAYFVALVAFLVRRWSARLPVQMSGSRGLLVIGGVVVVSLAAALGVAPLRAWFLNSLGTRAELIRAALVGSSDAWLVGFGASATETTLPPYVQWDRVEEASLLTIESEPVEWFFTYGWPVAIAAILLLVVYLVPPRPEDDWSERRVFFGDAAWVSAIFVAGISMLHFPFLALGVSLPAVLVVEGLLRQVFHRHHREVKRPELWAYPFVDLRWGRGLAWAILLGVTGVVGFVGSGMKATGVEAVAERPADAMVFAGLARDRLKAREFEAAEKFARRAAALEPTGRMLLLHASTLAANRRGEEAVAVYRSLRGFNLSGRAAAEAALVLPPALAAKAIEEPGRWRSAYDVILKKRGRQPAVEFALALVDLHPKSSPAAQVLIEAYWAQKQFDVAEMWARLVILENRLDALGNPIGPGLLVATLQKAGREAEARAEVARLFKVLPGDPTLQRAVLQLRPALEKATTEQVEQVGRAAELYCHSARVGVERKMCDLARAWVAEGRGDLKAAEDALRDVADRFDEPVALAEFFARTGQCAALRTFVAARQGRPGVEQVQAVSTRCGVVR